MKIKYIKHSGFIVEDSECALMIDCCGLAKKSDEVRRCEGKNFYVLASHIHGDHFDREIMSYGGERRRWILSDDIRGKVSPDRDIHFLAKGNAYRDEKLAIKAYGSTDVGISFYIEVGEKKIFHAGDLNNWHWNEEETGEDAAKNEQRYLDELALIAKELPELDAVMFPVDSRLGIDYARGAEQFLDSVKVGLFVPMHFWENIELARAFKLKAENRGCRFADISAAGDEFEV